MVPVPHAGLFARLTAQAAAGDPITITVTTEWHAEGYETYLSGFALPTDPVPVDAEQARA
jgi:hypothetical protein